MSSNTEWESEHRHHPLTNDPKRARIHSGSFWIIQSNWDISQSNHDDESKEVCMLALSHPSTCSTMTLTDSAASCSTTSARSLNNTLSNDIINEQCRIQQLYQEYLGDVDAEFAELFASLLHSIDGIPIDMVELIFSVLQDVYYLHQLDRNLHILTDAVFSVINTDITATTRQPPSVSSRSAYCEPLSPLARALSLIHDVIFTPLEMRIAPCPRTQTHAALSTSAQVHVHTQTQIYQTSVSGLVRKTAFSMVRMIEAERVALHMLLGKRDYGSTCSGGVHAVVADKTQTLHAAFLLLTSLNIDVLQTSSDSVLSGPPSTTTATTTTTTTTVDESEIEAGQSHTQQSPRPVDPHPLSAPFTDILSARTLLIYDATQAVSALAAWRHALSQVVDVVHCVDTEVCKVIERLQHKTHTLSLTCTLTDDNKNNDLNNNYHKNDGVSVDGCVRVSEGGCITAVSPLTKMRDILDISTYFPTQLQQQQQPLRQCENDTHTLMTSDPVYRGDREVCEGDCEVLYAGTRCETHIHPIHTHTRTQTNSGTNNSNNTNDKNKNSSRNSRSSTRELVCAFVREMVDCVSTHTQPSQALSSQLVRVLSNHPTHTLTASLTRHITTTRASLHTHTQQLQLQTRILYHISGVSSALLSRMPHVLTQLPEVERVEITSKGTPTPVINSVLDLVVLVYSEVELLRQVLYHHGDNQHTHTHTHTQLRHTERRVCVSWQHDMEVDTSTNDDDDTRTTTTTTTSVGALDTLTHVFFVTLTQVLCNSDSPMSAMIAAHTHKHITTTTHTPTSMTTLTPTLTTTNSTNTNTNTVCASMSPSVSASVCKYTWMPSVVLRCGLLRERQLAQYMVLGHQHNTSSNSSGSSCSSDGGDGGSMVVVYEGRLFLVDVYRNGTLNSSSSSSSSEPSVVMQQLANMTRAREMIAFSLQHTQTHTQNNTTTTTTATTNHHSINSTSDSDSSSVDDIVCASMLDEWYSTFHESFTVTHTHCAACQPPQQQQPQQLQQQRSQCKYTPTFTFPHHIFFDGPDVMVGHSTSRMHTLYRFIHTHAPPGITFHSGVYVDHSHSHGHSVVGHSVVGHSGGGSHSVGVGGGVNTTTSGHDGHPGSTGLNSSVSASASASGHISHTGDIDNPSSCCRVDRAFVRALWHIVCSVIHALASLHRHGIIHGNIHPRTICLVPDVDSLCVGDTVYTHEHVSSLHHPYQPLHFTTTLAEFNYSSVYTQTHTQDDDNCGSGSSGVGACSIIAPAHTHNRPLPLFTAPEVSYQHHCSVCNTVVTCVCEGGIDVCVRDDMCVSTCLSAHTCDHPQRTHTHTHETNHTVHGTHTPLVSLSLSTHADVWALGATLYWCLYNQCTHTHNHTHTPTFTASGVLISPQCPCVCNHPVLTAIHDVMVKCLVLDHRRRVSVQELLVLLDNIDIDIDTLHANNNNNTTTTTTAATSFSDDVASLRAELRTQTTTTATATGPIVYRVSRHDCGPSVLRKLTHIHTTDLAREVATVYVDNKSSVCDEGGVTEDLFQSVIQSVFTAPAPTHTQTQTQTHTTTDDSQTGSTDPLLSSTSSATSSATLSSTSSGHDGIDGSNGDGIDGEDMCVLGGFSWEDCPNGDLIPRNHREVVSALGTRAPMVSAHAHLTALESFGKLLVQLLMNGSTTTIPLHDCVWFLIHHCTPTHVVERYHSLTSTSTSTSTSASTPKQTHTQTVQSESSSLSSALAGHFQCSYVLQSLPLNALLPLFDPLPEPYSSLLSLSAEQLSQADLCFGDLPLDVIDMIPPYMLLFIVPPGIAHTLLQTCPLAFDADSYLSKHQRKGYFSWVEHMGVNLAKSVALHTKVTKKHVRIYAQLSCFWHYVGSRISSLLAICRGVWQVPGLHTLLSKYPVRQLKTVVSLTHAPSGADLVPMFSFTDEWPLHHVTPTLFLTYVSTLSTVQTQQLLKLMTSSAVLSPFKSYSFTVNPCMTAHALPVGHTCTFTLDLPVYESYERLQHMFDIALANVDGSSFDYY